jgi:M6 family metalloprotease-like protein
VSRVVGRRRLGWPAFGVGLLLALTPRVSDAQDIEAAARAKGIDLPSAYYDQVRSDPTSYSFSRALLARAGSSGGAVAGTVRLPVVLALFSDSQDPAITPDMVQASLFDGPSARGTITAAYLEMSRGALTVTGDVLPWVRTSFSLADVVGASNGLGNDGKVGAHFAEALDSLDASVDFSQYDSDGPDGVPNSGDDDGYVNVLTFEYLEVGAHCGGPAIWPHRWTLAARNGRPYATHDVGIGGDTIRINDYITQGVTDCTGLHVQDASTMSHEFGHALGLPDYYHWVDPSAGPRGRRWVLGCWALMAAGDWGCGPVEEPPTSFGPTHLMADSKQRLGWLQYVDVGEVWNQEFVLDPVETSGLALRVPMGPSGTEFLIAEYRAQIGFDADLPAGGVIFYKQDTHGTPQPALNGTTPYYLTLLEQDGNEGLLHTDLEGGNRGEAGDAWGVDGAVNKLHAETTPTLTLSDGSATPVTVHSVRVVGGQAHIVISTGRVPRLVPDGPLVALPETWRITGGTMPYTAVGYAPPGVTIDAEGDELTLAGASGGPIEVVVSVRDGSGNASDPVVASEVGASVWTVESADLLAPLLMHDAPALDAARLGYLDAIGNRNGSYDVGDLRRWLREHGSP